MSTSTLYRFGGLALILGGILSGTGYVLSPGSTTLAQFEHPLYLPSTFLRLVGAIFLLVGLPAMYVIQADKAGRLGLLGFTMAFLGLAGLEVGATGMTLTNAALVSSSDFKHLLTAMNEQLFQFTPLAAYFLSVLLATNLGLILYAIATYRARIYVWPISLLIFIGVVAVFAVSDAVGIALLMTGLVWAGVLLVQASATRATATNFATHM